MISAICIIVLSALCIVLTLALRDEHNEKMALEELNDVLNAMNESQRETIKELLNRI